MLDDFILKIKTLVYLNSIAATGSITMAAKNIGVEVKTMKKHLDEIQKKFNIDLVRTERHGTFLTKSGDKFYRENFPKLRDLEKTSLLFEARNKDVIRMLFPAGGMRLFLDDHKDHSARNPALIFECATYSWLILEEYSHYVKQMFEHYDVAVIPTHKLNLLESSGWSKIFHYESPYKLITSEKYLNKINLTAEDIRKDIEHIKKLNFINLTVDNKNSFKYSVLGKQKSITTKSILSFDAPEFQFQSVILGLGVAVIQESAIVTHAHLGVVDITPEGIKLESASVHYLMNNNYYDKHGFKQILRDFAFERYGKLVKVFV
jgi:molybdate transport repressor ModE-like protein